VPFVRSGKLTLFAPIELIGDDPVRRVQGCREVV
jgi:hypothetical protein